MRFFIHQSLQQWTLVHPSTTRNSLGVINSISMMVFPYKPTSKCNFMALKALGMTHKRYLIFSNKIGSHSRWLLLYEATLENRYQHSPYFVRPNFSQSQNNWRPNNPTVESKSGQTIEHWTDRNRDFFAFFYPSIPTAVNISAPLDESKFH